MMQKSSSLLSATESVRISTVEGVIQMIRTWIEGAQLKEGDRLPTERALAEQFNLNRNLVRRAFLQLDRMGLINRHVGRGTFVGSGDRMPAAASAAVSRDADHSPATILQARLMLEPRVAALAVANATHGDLKTLDGLLAEAETVEAKDRLESFAIAFQQALAAATHNDLIEAMAGEIAEARRTVAWRRGDRMTASRDERDAVVTDHREILNAVRARDPTAAATAVRRMLIRSTRTFSLLARMELLPDEE